MVHLFVDLGSSSTLATFKHEEQLINKHWCEHCNKPYHTKETHWKKYEKPTNWKPKNKKEKERPAYTTIVAPTSKKGTDLNLTTE